MHFAPHGEPDSEPLYIMLFIYKNASLPILVTPSGTVTLVKLLQYINALMPILVTFFGIVALVKLLQ